MSRTEAALAAAQSAAEELRGQLGEAQQQVREGWGCMWGRGMVVRCRAGKLRGQLGDAQQQVREGWGCVRCTSVKQAQLEEAQQLVESEPWTWHNTAAVVLNPLFRAAGWDCFMLLAVCSLFVHLQSHLQLSAMGAIESRLSLIDELNAELGSLAEQYGAARDELAAVRQQYDESRQQLAAATAEYGAVQQQLAAVQAKYDEAITREQEQVGHRAYVRCGRF